VTLKYVLLYETADDVMEKAPVHYPAHSAWADEFEAEGTLLMIGAFTNVTEHGSMAIFTSEEAAERFVAGDPFVQHGVVASHEIREWNEAIVPEVSASASS
jgi:uncharacterized protein YciI